MDTNRPAQSPSEQPRPSQPGEMPQPLESMPTPQVEGASNAPQSAPSTPTMPIIPSLPTDDQVTAPIADAAQPATAPGPAIADDVDVIEKEWVDKAQGIIEKTKEDPYQEEEQLEDLQLDYLKKRYGKDIKKESS